MWIFGVSGGICLNTWDVLKNAFSVLPFLIEGFRNLLHFFCAPPKARNLALECYYSLCKWWQKMLGMIQAGISLEFLWLLATSPYWKRVFVCKFGIVVLYLLISAVQLGVSCWETTTCLGVQEYYYGIFQLTFASGGLSLFLMSAIFDDSLSTLPSLKVILVSISSPPSWRCDIC